MNISRLVPGTVVVINGVRRMYVGPGNDGDFVLVEKSHLPGNFRWAILKDQACDLASQNWGEPEEGRLATADDAGTVVYDEDGDACMLIGVNQGRLNECVVSYGGDTLGWSGKCFIPADRDKADAEYAEKNGDEVVTEPCCQGACQGYNATPSYVMFSKMFPELFRNQTQKC